MGVGREVMSGEGVWTYCRVADVLQTERFSQTASYVILHMIYYVFPTFHVLIKNIFMFMVHLYTLMHNPLQNAEQKMFQLREKQPERFTSQ